MRKLSLVVITLLLVSMVAYGQGGWTDDGTKVRLTTSSDKVGVGVTSPYSKLHVQWSAAGPTQEENRSAIYGYNTSTDGTYANSIGLFGRVKTSKGMALYGYSENSNGYAGYFRGGLGINEDADVNIWRIDEDNGDDLLFRFSSNSGSSWSDILKILDNGNVGIGTTNPGKKLEVNGDIKIPLNNRMYFGSASIQGYQAGYGGLKFYGTGGGFDRLAITVDPAGRVGIGTTNPVEKLHVEGNSIITGNVGIGTTNPQSKLAVNGTITAKEMKVQTGGWPDFVFEDNYKLMSLNKLEKHIKREKSLPGIPTNEEVIEEGIKLGEMQAKLLEKVEELTLYVIELNKEVENLRKENKELRQKNTRSN